MPLTSTSDSPSSRLGGDQDEERRESHHGGSSGRAEQQQQHENHKHSHRRPSHGELEFAATRKTNRRQGALVKKCFSEHSIEHHHRHVGFEWPLASLSEILASQTRGVVARASSGARSLGLRGSLVLLACLLLVQSGACLDSPVKIQRNKLQLLQMQQQQQASLNGSQSASSNQVASEQPPRQTLAEARFDPLTQQQQQVASNASSKVDRVRRTNSEQSTGGRASAECPSQRLIQGLLPPEYAGSPATSQRPSQARAHCECHADSFGWRLTCLVGGGGGGVGAPSGQGRLSGVSSASMPNQLHPAFRTPQVARQQQVGARRQRRSSLNWFEESAGDPSLAANSSAASSQDEQMSPHEGFGEEVVAAPQAAPPTSTSKRPLAFKQNSRTNPNKNQNLHQDDDPFAGEQTGESRSQQQQQNGERLVSAASNNNHLTFQTIPILFSVRYLRNNMIEIDCDQAVPNYKAAMFRGFNVNEISSFTFNNCQLPNIPFSVLLHRTRSAAEPGQQQVAAAGPAPAGPGQQSLRPNRRQQFANQPAGLRRRRRQIDELAPRESGAESRPQPAQQQQAGAREPRVKSLVINLNAIVDQRTLITLLTGLDLLEDLQLNYMQLNLTSFINDLLQPTSSAPTTTTPSMAQVGSTTTSSTTTTTATSTMSPAASSTATSEELSLAASANVDKEELHPVRHAPSTSSNLVVVSPPPTNPTAGARLQSSTGGSGTSTSTSTTSTTTSTTTTSTTTTPAPTTTFNNLKPFKQKQQRPAPATTTIASSSTTVPSSSGSSSATSSMRPSLAMGAPRGLVVAQATGLPPSSAGGSLTTTPFSASPSSQGSSQSSSASSSSAPATTSSAATTTGSGSQVPSVALNTVLSSVSASSTQAGAGQPATTARQTQVPQTTTTTTGQVVGPGLRQPQQNAGPDSNLISIGVSQSHSVSYTANQPTASSQSAGLHTIRPQTGGGGMFHLQAPATTTTTSSSGLAPQPPQTTTNQATTTNLMGSNSNTGSAATAQLNPNRLHHSPSGWFAGSSSSGQPTTSTSVGPLAAGSRLSMSSGGQTTGGQSDMLTVSASSGGLRPPTAPPTSLFNWSAMNTPPASTQPGSTLSSLSAPANTPPLSMLQGEQPTATTNTAGGGQSFGFRTGGNGAGGSSSTSSSSFRTSMSSQQQQTRRQNVPTATTNGNNNFANTDPAAGGSGFVAAGGRLFSSAGPSNNQNSLAVGLNQNFNQNTRRFPPATTPNRFVSSLAAQNPNRQPPLRPFGEDDFAAAAQPPDHERGHREHSSFSPTGSGENGAADENEDLASMDTSTTPNLERIPRTRERRAAPSPPVEELELSFGDLLPSLRTLKLESFIDLSPLVAEGPSASGGNARQHQTRKRQGQSGVSLMRFRRQAGSGGDSFASSDLPERQGDEEDAAASDDQSASGLDHNSVMVAAPPSLASGGDATTTTSSHRQRQPPVRAAAHSRLPEEIDIEPGETLWRSASERHESAGGDSDESEGGPGHHLSIVPPPASFGASDEHTTSATPPNSGDSNDPAEVGPAETPEETLQGDSSASSRQQQAHLSRQRYASQVILAKLFSRLSKLQVLHLTSNEIPYWPDQVLADSRHSLLRLYLISNNIRQVGPRALANLNELRTLDLSSNQLRQLQPDLFRDLINLRQVRACRNFFRRLPLKLMMKQQVGGDQAATGGGGQTAKALAKLDSVDFSKNRYLSQFYLEGPAQVPAHLSLAPIVSLNLSDCSLTDQLLVLGGPHGKVAENNNSHQTNNISSQLQQLFFASLVDLTSISLQNNKFRDLLNVPNLFGKNKQLQRLDLSRNQLDKINGHLFNANASQLVELKLSHNKIHELPEQFLFNLRKLKHLSLSHNKLSLVASKTFLTNHLLESLDLSYNQLTSLSTNTSGQIPFGNGANLKHLNLAHNNLSAFEADLFDIAWSFYVQLHSLDLSHNKFSGQIQMPIFYTISDDMLLNLASNRIQSVSVDALVQHEQVLDKFATSYEGLAPGGPEGEDQHRGATGPATAKRSAGFPSKVPTVTIRLANNPLACDCLLEPLVSYSRRVAAASNPALVASLFQQQQHQQNAGGGSGLHAPGSPGHDPGLSHGSRYAFSASQPPEAGAARQPQLLYQFKFNDLYCDKPRALNRRLLSHISIGDLLCPIQDEHLCPRQCECHYQSAFKTVIVDCSGRQLTYVPEQLTDVANFHQFEVETSFNLSSAAAANSPHYQPGETSNKLTISQVDKMIIRLDNNRLTSVEALAHLFQVISIQQPQTNQVAGANQRFARSSRQDGDDLDGNLFDASSPTHSLELVAATNSSSQPNAKKKVSPVAMARLQHQQNQAQQQQQRQTRQASVGAQAGTARFTTEPNSNHLSADAAEHSPSNNNYLGGGGDAESPAEGANSEEHPEGGPSPATHMAMSTAVLESAEEFRNKRYLQKTCELYLDHNSIEALPEAFLGALDQVRPSALQTSSSPPQAALPTAMLEPPIHSKLSSAPGEAGNPMMGNSMMEPMKASASSLHLDELPSPGAGSLFGRQPLGADKKLALMETVQHNVRMSKLQEQQQASAGTQDNNNNRAKLTVSPSIVVLSLRYNALANINSRMLNRLSKLIKSSNTKIYLGHNPFNCSDNYYEPAVANSTATSQDGNEDATRFLPPASPMGDQLLAASDSVSGAYLEPSPDDLQPAASGDDSSSTENSLGSGRTSAGNLEGQQLSPSDCPVGQLKTWLTRHHSHVGDLDELYCVHMPPELAEKLKLTSEQVVGSSNGSSPSSGERLRARHVSNVLAASTRDNKRDHDHPWTSSLMSPSPTGGSGGGSIASDSPAVRFVNTSQVHKGGLTWNADLLMQKARLIDVDVYDLCPYSNVQLVDPSASYLSPGHQQALISVAIVFILLSLCLLMMLIYFGDTQTILAFVYIHLNPIYQCLHLNESHLDGEKLYDAFVSYSSADRDIVMQLIEHLEQPPGFDGQKLLNDGKATNLDKSRDTLVTEADLRPDLLPAPVGPNYNQTPGATGLGTLQRRSTSTLAVGNSFQDLSTMSRSTSRMLLDGGGDTTLNNNRSASEHQMEVLGAQRSGPAANENELANGSSTTTRPYRLCIHERDWLPGHLISWNIVNSVQNSRRTILILSKEFIKSVWFQVEFHTAYYQMLEDKIDRLIVIVRGELPPKHELDKNLAFLLTTKTYLTWGEKWFWERLHYALPHRAGPPPPLAGQNGKARSKVVAGAQGKPTPKHYHQKPSVGQVNTPTGVTTKYTNGSSASLLSSLAAGHADPPRHQQQPLVAMSNIGKDCSNLFLHTNSSSTPGRPNNNNNNNHLLGSGGSSSSAASSTNGGPGANHQQVGGAAGARSTSASSFLSGSSSSTNQLFKPDFNENHQQTTSNDLLSSPVVGPANNHRPTVGNNTTRLSIGNNLAGMRSSSPLATDSGRITADRLSSSQLSVSASPANTSNAPPTTTSGGITSIMLDGGLGSSQNGGPNSRLRAKKQEKLQNFVEKEISSRFNLSEL